MTRVCCTEGVCMIDIVRKEAAHSRGVIYGRHLHTEWPGGFASQRACHGSIGLESQRQSQMNCTIGHTDATLPNKPCP
jgi:hypothetical protein